MNRTRRLLVLVVLLLAGAALYAYVTARPATLVLTGLVTTNDIIVSPQIGGRIAELLVKEGDQVKKGQHLGAIAVDELRADSAYYAQSAEGLSSQVRESEAALRYQRRQTVDQVAQAESMLASTEGQVNAAVADAENARLTYARTQDLAKRGVISPQELDQARTAFDAATAKLDSLRKQVEAQRSTVALARSSAEQVAVRRSQVETNEHLQAAAAAQKAKADVRLRYTEITAPIDGLVDVRAARAGEYAVPGQPVLTLIDPDDLWVRADVEETYVDRVRVGDKLTVRLPSGVERQGTVFYRGLDAAYATQRDVSRTKRDIRTFEFRLRVDNSDRRLAVGMTAYVVLPVR
ncbi:MAG: HlyD family secretion protein [Acidobacteriota bacterium]|jgi:HlyD family secretion protein